MGEGNEEEGEEKGRKGRERWEGGRKREGTPRVGSHPPCSKS